MQNIYLFLKFLLEKKFKKAIKKIYNTEREDLIYSPGLHTSKQTPATFNEMEFNLQEMEDCLFKNIFKV